MKNLFSIKYSDQGISLAALLLRIALGGLMIPIGFYKLSHFGQLTPSFLNFLHLGRATSLALVVFAEVFCASFIVLGLFTRLSCIPLLVVMCVVVFYVNHGNMTGNNTNATLFLAGYLALFIMGPGKISLDKMIGK